jgi:hypothetical protein
MMLSEKANSWEERRKTPLTQMIKNPKRLHKPFLRYAQEAEPEKQGTKGIHSFKVCLSLERAWRLCDCFCV